MSLKSETARINGAKSHGPVTPEGKQKASRNALRHGLNSKIVVLPHESLEDFENLRDSYLARFQPADQPESDLVETMVLARWRLNRLIHIEANILEKEMLLRTDEIEKEGFSNMTPEETLAWCFDRSANHDKSLALLVRYESHLNRTYERAFKQLQTLQSTRPPSPPPELRNEPKPVLVAPSNPPPESKMDPETLPSSPDNPPAIPLEPAPHPSPEPQETGVGLPRLMA